MKKNKGFLSIVVVLGFMISIMSCKPSGETQLCVSFYDGDGKGVATVVASNGFKTVTDNCSTVERGKTLLLVSGSPDYIIGGGAYYNAKFDGNTYTIEAPMKGEAEMSIFFMPRCVDGMTAPFDCLENCDAQYENCLNSCFTEYNNDENVAAAKECLAGCNSKDICN